MIKIGRTGFLKINFFLDLQQGRTHDYDIGRDIVGKYAKFGHNIYLLDIVPVLFNQQEVQN